MREFDDDKKVGWKNRAPAARANPTREAEVGAYMLYHPGTGQAYVGSTADLYRRERKHEATLRAGKHYNPRLQQAYDQDPRIEVTILVTETRAEARDFEQGVLNDFYDSGLLFNEALSASNSMQGRHHTAETRAQMSAGQVGKVFADETKLKMRLAKLGKPAQPYQLPGLAQGRIARQKAVIIHGVRYESITAAGHAIGMDPELVRRRVHSDRSKYADWVFAHD